MSRSCGQRVPHQPRALTCRPLASHRRLRQGKTDTVRCIKSCRPRDMACALDPAHTISHTVVSLPTFREFTQPEGECPYLLSLCPALRKLPFCAQHWGVREGLGEGVLHTMTQTVSERAGGVSVMEWRVNAAALGCFLSL